MVLAAAGVLAWQLGGERPRVVPAPSGEEPAARELPGLAEPGAAESPEASRAAGDARGAKSGPPVEAPASDAASSGAPAADLPPLRARVRVVARESGEAIEGAELLAWERPPAERIGAELDVATAARLATSDAEGLAAPTMPAQVDALVVRAAGYGLAWCTRARLEEESAAPAVVALEREGRLIARVSGPGGAAVAGARVVVFVQQIDVTRPIEARSRFQFFPRLRLDALTTVEGEAQIGALPSWVDLAVALEPPQGAAAAAPVEPQGALRLAPGETIVREWRLGGGIALEGRLVDEQGVALPDAQLWVLALDDAAAAERRLLVPGDEPHVQAGAFTDAEGRFRIEGLAPGRRFVGPAPWTRGRVGHADHGLVALAVAIELREGTVVHPLELVGVRGRFVSGQAVDGQGGGVAGRLEYESLAPEAAGVVEHAVADFHGMFRVGPVLPGEVALQFVPQEARHARPGRLVVEAGRDDVVIEVGSGGVLDVEAFLAGSSAPLAASFVVVREGGEGTAWLGGRGAVPVSDDRFEGLPAGFYTVGATTKEGFAGFATGVAVVEGDVRRAAVVLERGALLRVVLPREVAEKATLVVEAATPDRAPVVVAVVELPGGDERTVVVPPGPATLRADLGDATVFKDLALDPATTTTLTLSR